MVHLATARRVCIDAFNWYTQLLRGGRNRAKKRGDVCKRLIGALDSKWNFHQSQNKLWTVNSVHTKQKLGLYIFAFAFTEWIYGCIK